MRYIVGFTEAPGLAPFYVYESEMVPPDFAVGSKVFAASEEDPSGWKQVTGLAYQLHPGLIVTTVVVGDVVNVGGDGEEFLAWPW